MTHPSSPAKVSVAQLLQPSEHNGDSGGDDYCALCRRCQLRKKLERRLAQRQALVNSTESDEPVLDDRPIDDLLRFIGGRVPVERRKSRRRRSGAHARSEHRAQVTQQHTPSSVLDVPSAAHKDVQPVPVPVSVPVAVEVVENSHKVRCSLDWEMSREEEEAIDREVEAFRRLLESAHIRTS